MYGLGLLFIKTSPVKQYSYENDLSVIFEALHQSFLVILCFPFGRIGKILLPDQEAALKILWEQNDFFCLSLFSI